MSNIDAKRVSELRRETGAPMMECKRALEEAGGDGDRAKEILRLRGLQAADRKTDRTASEGRIFSYIHSDRKIGVLLEIDCETDFVARNEEFADLGHDLCLHLAFTRPRFLRREDVPPAEVEKERCILLELVRQKMGDKPEAIQEKAVEGKLRLFFEKQCFMEQKFVKDDSKTIEVLLKEKIAKIGENLVIKQFTVFSVGG